MFSIAQITKAALISLVLTLVALAGAKLNLFGFEDATDTTSDDVFQSITAGHYGTDRVGQNKVRIVYIDEPGVDTLRQHGWEGWPPGFSSLAIMLEDLTIASGVPPRAIFADLVITGDSISSDQDRAAFADLTDTIGSITHASTWSDIPACSRDPLVRIGCIIEAQGVPVVLAKPNPLDRHGLTDAQRALDAIAVLSPILVDPRAYPLVETYRGDEIAGVHRFDLSPAAALYASNCLFDILRNGREGACGGDPTFSEAARAARAALHRNESEPTSVSSLELAWGAPVAVLWGDREAERQADITQQVSTGAIPTCNRRVGIAERTLRRMFNASSREATCAYTFHIGYDRLVAGLGLNQSDYDFILADRLVLVGSHLRNSDWVPTPVQGQLPGVHYHAMALDNLLEMGPDYRRADTGWLSTDDILVSILTFVLLLAVILAVMARNSVLEDVRPEWKTHRPVWALILYYGALVVLVGGLTFLIALAGAHWWNRAVINWLGVVALALGVLAMAGRLTLLADVGGPLGFVDNLTRRLEFGDRSLSRRPPPTPQPKPAPERSPAPRTRARRTRKPTDASS